MNKTTIATPPSATTCHTYDGRERASPREIVPLSTSLWISVEYNYLSVITEPGEACCPRLPMLCKVLVFADLDHLMVTSKIRGLEISEAYIKVGQKLVATLYHMFRSALSMKIRLKSGAAEEATEPYFTAPERGDTKNGPDQKGSHMGPADEP